MFSNLLKSPVDVSGLLNSSLFDENTFYNAFVRDLNRCTDMALIESPFITGNRVASLLLIFKKMRSRSVGMTINTRPPIEHNAPFDMQASDAIKILQDMGVQVLFTGSHHRKLAVFDPKILWEGSLNILSQNDSCEVMRRIDSYELAIQMLHFTKLDKFLG